jgi:hypothetical protein
MDDIKIDTEVATVLGNGIVKEIRTTKTGVVFLIELKPGGFGRGYSDVFERDEIELA